MYFFSNTFCDIIILEIAAKVYPQLLISGALVFHVHCVILIVKSHHLLDEVGRALSECRARRVFEKLVLEQRDKIAISNV
jgi:hypothetical protein